MGGCMGCFRRSSSSRASRKSKTSTNGQSATGNAEPLADPLSATPFGAPGLQAANGTSSSRRSDVDWHECREDFSVIDSSGSLRLAASGEAEAAAAAASAAARGSGHRSGGEDFDDGDLGRPGGDDSDSSQEALAAQNKAGCLSLMRGPPQASTMRHVNSKGGGGTGRSQRRSNSGARPSAGCSLTKRDMGQETSEVRESWDPCDGTDFKVRGSDYMTTKRKVDSAKGIYTLVAADMFTFDTKAFHIAKMLGHLPPAPPARHSAGGTGGQCLPPLIIFNIQMPTYSPSFFGSNDGPGHSIVYYFALAEDFDPAAVNPHALGLLQRYVCNGREADGTPTRDRMKVIPRVVNVEEWRQKGPLSYSEHKALVGYNGKPILARPQQAFYHGPNYLEVDLDVHQYAFMARKALQSYFSRLKEAVWDIAFVIQGNAPEELPEVVLGAACLYRTDFDIKRPFAEYCKRASSAGDGPGALSASRQASQRVPDEAPLQADGVAVKLG